MSLCPLYSKCHFNLDIPNVTLSLKCHSVLDIPIPSCQSKVTLSFSRATKSWCRWLTEFSGITPYDDVTDRLIASHAVRTINVVPYDVIDRVLQVFDPFSENASYPFF